MSGLGSFAGGFARGLDFEAAPRAAERAQRMSLADFEMGRAKKRATAEDLLAADMEAARAAGQKVFADDQATQQATLDAAPLQGPTEDGGHVPRAQLQGPTLDGASLGNAPRMAKPQSSPQTILKAAKAHHDELLNRGRITEGQQAWAAAEARRASLREEAARGLEAATMKGGDITQAAQAFYDLIDNGQKIKSAVVSVGPDGQPIVTMQTAREDNDEAMGPPVVQPVDAIMSNVAQILEKPGAWAQRFWLEKKALMDDARARALDKEKTARQRDADIEKDKRDRARDTANADRAEKVANIQAGATLGAARIRADDKDGDGAGSKAQKQARDYVDSMRNALNQAKEKAIKVRLEGSLDAGIMTTAQRDALIDGHPDVKEANERLRGAIKDYEGIRAGSKQGGSAPPANLLKPNVNTKFKNGQVWTLRDGKPVQVQ